MGRVSRKMFHPVVLRRWGKAPRACLWLRERRYCAYVRMLVRVQETWRRGVPPKDVWILTRHEDYPEGVEAVGVVSRDPELRHVDMSELKEVMNVRKPDVGFEEYEETYEHWAPDSPPPEPITDWDEAYRKTRIDDAMRESQRIVNMGWEAQYRAMLRKRRTVAKHFGLRTRGIRYLKVVQNKLIQDLLHIRLQKQKEYRARRKETWINCAQHVERPLNRSKKVKRDYDILVTTLVTHLNLS